MILSLRLTPDLAIAIRQVGRAITCTGVDRNSSDPAGCFSRAILHVTYTGSHWRSAPDISQTSKHNGNSKVTEIVNKRLVVFEFLSNALRYRFDKVRIVSRASFHRAGTMSGVMIISESKNLPGAAFG